MSKERELLKRILKFIVPGEDNESLDYDLLLYSQILDLLAQPEQKPLTINENLIDLNQVDKHLVLCDKSEDYRDGYCDGIIYAEREHDIRGKFE